MYDPLTAAIIIGTTLTAGASLYGTQQAKRSAKKERETTEEAAARTEERFQEQKTEEAKETAQTKMRLQKRRGATKAGAGKPRSTILTGPLGVIGAPSTERKTLLGR